MAIKFQLSLVITFMAFYDCVRTNPVSRITINDIQQGIDYDTLSREQQSDPETDAYKTAVSNLTWEYVPINNTQVLCDVSTGRPRPLVPTTFRRKIFDVVHGLAHPSIRSTIKLIKVKFVWHTMAKDIRIGPVLVMHVSAVRYSDTPEQTSVHFLTYMLT